MVEDIRQFACSTVAILAQVLYRLSNFPFETVVDALTKMLEIRLDKGRAPADDISPAATQQDQPRSSSGGCFDGNAGDSSRQRSRSRRQSKFSSNRDKKISANSLEYAFLTLHDANAKAHRTLTDHISPLPNSFKRLLDSDVGFQGGRERSYDLVRAQWDKGSTETKSERRKRLTILESSIEFGPWLSQLK